MEDKALQYIKESLDKATQKGAFSLAEIANIIACLEQLNKFIISTNNKKEE